MPAARYVRVPAAWNATVDLSSPEPARFCVSLLAQTLEYGAPARRRFGPAWALLGRHGLPERAMAGALRVSGRALPTAAALDDVLGAVERAWPQLRAADDGLPELPRLSALQLARSSATTTFVFGGSPAPLLVAKLPRDGRPGVEREVAALQEAAGTGAAPGYLGHVPGAGHVQRGLAGKALAVAPLSAARAHLLSWTPQHEAMAAGLAALARATAKPVVADALQDDVLDAALAHPLLSTTARDAVREARAAVGDLAVSVLRHGDSSPQNVLLDGATLSGLVDWEDATSAGLPGSDLLNCAVASIENGVGLVRWDEQRLLSAFRSAWSGSGFGRSARAAAARCTTAAGVPEELVDPMEVVFFARRVGHRLRRPGAFPTSADLAAHVLEHVCRERAQPL